MCSFLEEQYYFGFHLWWDFDLEQLIVVAEEQESLEEEGQPGFQLWKK